MYPKYQDSIEQLSEGTLKGKIVMMKLKKTGLIIGLTSAMFFWWMWFVLNIYFLLVLTTEIIINKCKPTIVKVLGLMVLLTLYLMVCDSLTGTSSMTWSISFIVPIMTILSSSLIVIQTLVNNEYWKSLVPFLVTNVIACGGLFYINDLQVSSVLVFVISGVILSHLVLYRKNRKALNDELKRILHI